MEVFTPERESEAIFSLIGQLGALGVRGRDASYLASIAPDATSDPQLRDRYRAEFRYIVPPASQAAAALLLGMPDWHRLD